MINSADIKAVFLDIDNTLLSFTGYVKQAMRDGFALFGLRPYEDTMYPVFERVNNAVWRRLEQGTLTYENLLKIRWATIFQELGIDGDGPVFEEYFRGQLFSSAIPEPHSMEMLDYLHGRYTLCIASNGPYRQQMNRLRLAGMDQYIDFFFVSEKIGASKPSRAFFDHCFAELRCERFADLRPEETIIIGDSMTSDMAGGKEYGMHTCLYQPDDQTVTVQDAVDCVIRSLSEVRDIL